MIKTHHTLEHLDQTDTPCTRCGLEIHFSLAGHRDGHPLCIRCFRLERTDLAPILGHRPKSISKPIDRIVGNPKESRWKRKPLRSKISCVCSTKSSPVRGAVAIKL